MSRVISVNVSQPREVEFRGHLVSTGIYKSPVEGPVRVEGVNLEGDDQAQPETRRAFIQIIRAH